MEGKVHRPKLLLTNAVRTAELAESSHLAFPKETLTFPKETLPFSKETLVFPKETLPFSKETLSFLPNHQ